MKKQISFIAIISLLLFSAYANASVPTVNSAGLLDDILQRFATTASSWSGKMLSYGQWLFWGLALFSMVWTYSMMLLKKGDAVEVLAELVRFLAVTGFFFWIMINGPAISTSIMDSLRQIAASATGLPNSLSPSGIIDIGFDVAGKVIDKSSLWSPTDSLVGMLIATAVLIMLAIIAINMLLMLITGWLLAYAGIFILGFGGGKWTQDIAIGYYKQVIGVGIQTFTMILIIGIGHSFIDQYYAAVGTDVAVKSLLVLLISSLVILLLVDKIPPMFAGIVTGGSMSGGGLGNMGMGAALGAAGAAAGLAGAAGASVLGAATSAGGGASALKAAFEHAQQAMSSDLGSGSGGGSSPKSGSSFSDAMGRAAQFTGHMASSLGSSAMDLAKEKADSIKSSVQESVGNTTGGKIAENIRENMGGNDSAENTESPNSDTKSNSSSSEFSQNGFESAQNETVSDNPDYNDFVNKKNGSS